MQTQPADGALSGLTVVDLSRLLPGPYCSMVLADHGARVIVIDDPQVGDDVPELPALYRNKERVALDLRRREGREIFLRLAAAADVVLEGFRPGVVRQLGVDYDALRDLNPGLVYCSISGYGQTGPLRERAGHDANYLARSGVLDQMGLPDRPPAIPGVQVADIAGGALHALAGILMALWARERNGAGQYVDISMTDAMVGFLTVPFFMRELFGRDPLRGDALLSHRYACYHTYRTADGRYLALGAVENRFWVRLCEHLNLAEYGPLQYDEQRREEIKTRFEEMFAARPLADWEAELGDLDVCFAPVRTPGEVLEDPLFRRRGVVLDPSEPGLTPTIGVPVKLSRTPGSVRTPPAGPGAHTGKVLREIGCGEGEIGELYREGVVK